MDSLAGMTIRWVFDDGPMSGMSIEHSFNTDGSVTWRMIDGQYAGASAREQSYGAVKVNASVWAISYLASSGHTLTTVLDFDTGRVFGFASNNTTWESQHGRFSIVEDRDAFEARSHHEPHSALRRET
jgi:hypothetical protein